MKKYLISMLTILVLTCSLLTGCGKSNSSTPSYPPQNTQSPPQVTQPQKLTVPTILWDYANERITWNCIQNAEKYDVVFCNTSSGDKIEQTYNNYLELPTGTYEIKVKALSGDLTKYLNSNFSTNTIFTISQVTYGYEILTEKIDNKLLIYFYSLTDLPVIDHVQFFDTKNQINISCSQNDLSICRKDISMPLSGYYLSLENHECYKCEIDLTNVDSTTINARFYSTEPYKKSSIKKNLYTYVKAS